MRISPFLHQLCLLSLYIFWLMQVCILAMILTLSFFILAHDRL